MDENIPTYLPGDTIALKLEIQHQVNLDDVWAVFRKEEEVTTIAQFKFSATLRDRSHLRLLRWSGQNRTSEILLEALVSNNDQLPGVYELAEVHGLPYGESQEARNSLTFDVPDYVRFRVAHPPAGHTPRVTRWEFRTPTEQSPVSYLSSVQPSD